MWQQIKSKLKRLLLPFEFEDHPLYYCPPTKEEQSEDDELWDEIFGSTAPPLIIHRDE